MNETAPTPIVWMNRLPRIGLVFAVVFAGAVAAPLLFQDGVGTGPGAFFGYWIFMGAVFVPPAVIASVVIGWAMDRIAARGGT